MRWNEHTTKQNVSKKYVLRVGRIPWNKGIKIDRKKYPNIGHFKKHNNETRKKMRDSWKKENT